MLATHKREIDLSAPISETVQGAAEEGGFGGLARSAGGDVHVYIHALDAKSFEERIDQHTDAIARAVSKGLRHANPVLHDALRGRR
jgi:hypothetical protein